MNLDVLVGCLCIWMAACIAGIMIFADPRASKWPSAPNYVRWSTVPATLALLWRGVNLVSLANSEPPVPGQANMEAFIASTCLATLVTAVTVWISLSIMPDKGWEKLRWAASIMRHNPKMAPLMVDPVELAHASGVPATGPGDGVASVILEDVRFRREHERHAATLAD